MTSFFKYFTKNGTFVKFQNRTPYEFLKFLNST
jgi:hypothetical protein